MKPLKFIFILVLCLATTTTAQTVNDKVQKLIDAKLITENQKTAFKQFIPQTDSTSNALIIYMLFAAEYKLDTGHNYSPSETFFDFKLDNVKPEIQKKANDSLQRYLKRLKTADLVTDSQFKDQLKRINNNEYIHLFQFLPNLGNEIYFEEWMSQDKLNCFRKQLIKNQIINSDENQRLLKDINKGIIKSPYALLKYCSKARFFDLGTYSNDPSIYIEQIHQTTAEILPELQFSNFKHEIKIDSTRSFQEYTFYKLVTTVTSNGKTYKQRSFISPKDIGEDDNYLGKLADNEYIQLFNKILIDLQSPYRLHAVNARNIRENEYNNYQYFGVIALKEEQITMFNPVNSYWQLSYENFHNNLTTNAINTAITSYKEIGLFNHLTSLQINTAKARVKAQTNHSLNGILSTFDGIIFSFDYELDNLNNPYEEIISKYAEITHQEFNPTNIKDSFNIDVDTASLSFTFNKKTYEKNYIIDGDWVDINIFKFMKDLAKENKLKGRYYMLESDAASIIYLTQKQYDYIKAHQLLKFAE